MINRCECPIEPSLGCLSNHTAFATRLYAIKQFQLNQIDITIEQLRIMIVLWKGAELSQKDIAYLIGKDKTSVSRLINGLEKRKLVKRVNNLNDKRHKLIVITDEGKNLEDSTMKVLKDATSYLNSNFSQAEIESTAKVLKALCNLIYNKEDLKNIKDE